MKKLKKMLFFIAMSISFVFSCSFVSAMEQNPNNPNIEKNPIKESENKEQSNIEKETNINVKKDEPVVEEPKRENIQKRENIEQQENIQKQENIGQPKEAQSQKESISGQQSGKQMGGQDNPNIEKQIIKEEVKKEVNKEVNNEIKKEVNEENKEIKKEIKKVKENVNEIKNDIINLTQVKSNEQTQQTKLNMSVLFNIDVNKTNTLESFNFYKDEEEKVFLDYKFSNEGKNNLDKTDNIPVGENEGIKEIFDWLNNFVTKQKEDKFVINLDNESDTTKYNEVIKQIDNLRKIINNKNTK